MTITFHTGRYSGSLDTELEHDKIWLWLTRKIVTITVTEKMCEYTRGRWIESSGCFSRWREWCDLRRRPWGSASSWILAWSSVMTAEIDVWVCMRECGDSRSTWSGFLSMEHCMDDELLPGRIIFWGRKHREGLPILWIRFCIQEYTYTEQNCGRCRAKGAR